jgi:2,4-dienoyl-CoA reductase-like NADH-dependent reductase (Old Yellow Enzyme family)
MESNHLFSPLTLRSLTLRNRIGISPMCQYSSVEGHANDWHLMHLGARAAGGAGLVIMEATGVEARGRITAGDTGIWSDDHVKALKPIAAFIKQMGAVAAIQLAHAGRKASCDLPWKGGKPLTAEQGAWQTVGPSPIPFDTGWHTPAQATTADITTIIEAFKSAARRALAAGFQVAEVHGAHGYLLHSFYSPLSNQRTDSYGGSFEGRTRLIREVTAAVRSVWPDDLPVLVRISATDWTEGGWTIEDSISLAKQLKAAGADLIDCSSAGNTPKPNIPGGPVAGYQVPLSAAIRAGAATPTAAVGLITSAQQADEIIRAGKADLVLIARESLRNPNFPIDAARTLGVPAPIQNQYARAY